ncbi:hypothetical protein NM208_g14982 [Fusarium decemcellulare]|uniref:Uncharacterized protein n=1 Tax=Fusarium decemcellulare TaxID=57161 RepID=A0ACC1RHU3_9HYPO|nr:hypothetical protein NM208_g14982 [Fusarium decemcellulare]
MPIASQCPLVLNCVLALAAGDLAKYQPASSGMASLTCGFYGQAVAGVNLALSREFDSSGSPRDPRDPSSHRGSNSAHYAQREDDILLAVILLCVHEVVNFTSTSRIFPHLNAAAALCHSRCSSIAAPNLPLRGLLFEIFCYIFTLTASTHGRNLPLHLASEVFTSPFLSGSSYKGMLLGQQCRDIFSVILRVSILRHGIASTAGIDEPIVSELRTLQAQLEDSPTIGTSDAGDARSDDKAVSELYRLACLIQINKTLNPMLQDRSPLVQDLISQFISTLSAVPSTSPANNILCWPLFMAGMSSTATAHQRLIVGRLRRNYESWWRSDILSRTADFLSKSWRDGRVASEGEAVRCRDSDAAHCPRLATLAFDFPLVLL